MWLHIERGAEGGPGRREAQRAPRGRTAGPRAAALKGIDFAGSRAEPNRAERSRAERSAVGLRPRAPQRNRATPAASRPGSGRLRFAAFSGVFRGLLPQLGNSSPSES